VNQHPKINIIPKKQRIFNTSVLVFVAFLYLFSLFQLKLTFFGGADTILKSLSFILRMLTMNFVDWQDVLYAALESISVAVLATIISAFFAFFTSFLAAANVSPKGLVWFLQGLAAAIRAVPTLIWTLIFVAYLGFGPFAGVLGLCFHSFAYLVKAFSQTIEEVDEGCLEAMKATGSSWVQIMARGVVPIIKTAVISWTALRFEFNIGQSTILGLVGAGGIGHELSLSMRAFDFETAGFVMLVIFLMSFSVEMIFNKLKLNVDKGIRV
jgi:phosphonate transport system permease protein